MLGERSSDQELAGRAKGGDNGAFDELWRRHEPQVLRLCRRYLETSARDSGADPEDLALDTFVRALHYLHRYEDQSARGAGFRAWLLSIARRLCLTSLREQRRRAGPAYHTIEELTL